MALEDKKNPFTLTKFQQRKKKKKKLNEPGTGETQAITTKQN